MDVGATWTRELVEVWARELVERLLLERAASRLVEVRVREDPDDELEREELERLVVLELAVGLAVRFRSVLREDEDPELARVERCWLVALDELEVRLDPPLPDRVERLEEDFTEDDWEELLIFLGREVEELEEVEGLEEDL